MIDIVDRGRTYIRFEEPDDYEGHVVWLMADELERLREALRRLAALDEFVNGEPTSIEEVMNYTQYVARAALEEKK